MIHTPSLTKVRPGLDLRALRAVQSLAQHQITARERMQAQLLRMTADYDSIGPLWTATTYGLGYVEKPGYMVLDGLNPVTAISIVPGGMTYEIVATRKYTVGYDHVLLVYRLHDPERLYRDHLQLQVSQLFRQSIKLHTLSDHRYSFSLNIPATAEHLFTRANVLRYLQKYIERVSAVERIVLTGQGSQTLVEVRLCLRQL